MLLCLLPIKDKTKALAYCYKCRIVTYEYRLLTSNRQHSDYRWRHKITKVIQHQIAFLTNWPWRLLSVSYKRRISINMTHPKIRHQAKPSDAAERGLRGSDPCSCSSGGTATASCSAGFSGCIPSRRYLLTLEPFDVAVAVQEVASFQMPSLFTQEYSVSIGNGCRICCYCARLGAQ